MMHVWKVFILIVTIAALIAIGIGCSDDDDSSTGPVIGDPEDPNFSQIMIFSGNVFEVYLDELATSVALTGRLSSGKSELFQVIGRWPDFTSVGHTYSAASGWHVFTIEGVVYHGDGLLKQADDSLGISGIDSIRIVDTSGAYIETNLADFEIATIETRSICELVDYDGPTIIDTAFFTLTGPFDEGDFEVDLQGSGGLSWTSESIDDCDVLGNYGMTWTDLMLNVEHILLTDSDCPNHGTIDFNMNLQQDCSAGETPDTTLVEGPVTVSYAFSGGQVTATATHNNTVWNMSAWCGPNPTDLSSSDRTFVAQAFSDHFRAFEYDLFIAAEYISTLGPMTSGRLGLETAAGIDSIVIFNVGFSGYSNGWHIANFTAKVYENGTDTLYFQGMDSIRIYEDGVVVQFPTTSVSRIETHSHFNLTTSGNRRGDLHHWLDFEPIEVGGVQMAKANGTLRDTVTVNWTHEFGGCTAWVTHHQTVTDGVFNQWSEDCPHSGSVTVDGEIDIFCTGSDQYYNTQGSWTATAVANGDTTVSMTFDNGYTNWSQVESCGGK